MRCVWSLCWEWWILVFFDETKRVFYECILENIYKICSFIIRLIVTVILLMFITPDIVVTYPCDRLLPFRNRTAQLDQGQRSLVSQLGLRRRGCRAGAHCQRRPQVARGVTSSTTRTSTCWEIPTIVGHRIVSNISWSTHGATSLELIIAYWSPHRAVSATINRTSSLAVHHHTNWCSIPTNDPNFNITVIITARLCLGDILSRPLNALRAKSACNRLYYVVITS